ncbi:hypothetical protein JZ751_008219, partial [Albula glossodonta]
MKEGGGCIIHKPSSLASPPMPRLQPVSTTPYPGYSRNHHPPPPPPRRAGESRLSSVCVRELQLSSAACGPEAAESSQCTMKLPLRPDPIRPISTTDMGGGGGGGNLLNLWTQ